MKKSDFWVLLVSGPIAVGKTSFANELIETSSFKKIRSGDFLSQLATARGSRSDRTGLQELGDSLDVETDYRWVVESVAGPLIAADVPQRLWLFDAVRKQRQVEHFRARFEVDVFHVHLIAPEEVLRARYEERRRRGDDYLGSATYDEVVRHPNEIEARSLGDIADLRLDTHANSPAALGDAVRRALDSRK